MLCLRDCRNSFSWWVPSLHERACACVCVCVCVRACACMYEREREREEVSFRSSCECEWKVTRLETPISTDNPILAGIKTRKTRSEDFFVCLRFFFFCSKKIWEFLKFLKTVKKVKNIFTSCHDWVLYELTNSSDNFCEASLQTGLRWAISHLSTT